MPDKPFSVTRFPSNSSSDYLLRGRATPIRCWDKSVNVARSGGDQSVYRILAQLVHQSQMGPQVWYRGSHSAAELTSSGALVKLPVADEGFWTGVKASAFFAGESPCQEAKGIF